MGRSQLNLYRINICLLILFELLSVHCYSQSNKDGIQLRKRHRHKHHYHHQNHHEKDICEEDSDCGGGGGRGCRWGRCVCRPCPEESLSEADSIVCGSDGREYLSHCDLERKACLRGDTSSLFVVNEGNCLHFLEKKLHQIEPGEIADQHEFKPESVETPQKNLVECSEDNFEMFKSKLFDLTALEWRNLVGHNREQRVEDKDKQQSESADGGGWKSLLADGPEADKDHLIQLIFSWIDRNKNFVLDYSELYHKDVLSVVGRLANSTCQLREFLLFGDTNGDGKIHVTEFYYAFSSFYGVTMISLEKSLEWKKVSVNLGDNIRLRCDIIGSPPSPIFWQRISAEGPSHSISNSGDRSSDPHLSLDVDGTLLIMDVQLSHVGNYSCQSVRNGEVVQIHSVVVSESNTFSSSSDVSRRISLEDYFSEHQG